MDEIEKAKQILRDAGYQVDNLWHIDDVQGNYNCTDEQAMEVLEGALMNDYVMETIFGVIDDEVNYLGLTRKED
jgi:hypothetical protein